MHFECTTPVRVLYRGTYSTEGDGRERVAFKSGKLVEFVKLMDESTGSIFDWTLAEAINGQCKVGDLLLLEVEQSAELTSGRSRGGREYVVTKYKHRIVGAKPAGAIKAAA